MNIPAIDKELRHLRAEKVMQALQDGHIGRGQRVSAWQDWTGLKRDYEEAQVSWGNPQNGGWSSNESVEGACKLKIGVFNGGTATCWEVLDTGDELILGRTTCNENLSCATVWSLPEGFWPGVVPQQVSQPSHQH